LAVKTSRLKELLGERLAIVGGGRFCRKLLAFLTEADDDRWRPEVVAVVDPDPEAPGLQLASQREIPVFSDHRQIFDLPGLTTVIEITSDPGLSEVLQRLLPAGVRLIDHIDVRTVWDALQLEALRTETLAQLRQLPGVTPEIEALIRDLANRFSAIAERRGKRSSQIEQELSRQQRALAQIVEGSAIPTFVIDDNHLITHWNRTMELLTGCRAAEKIGTRDQWTPFWNEPRPSMADVVLDGLGPEALDRLYGNQWRRSSLIPEGYEAEVLFPGLGEGGRWCWFTAAPLKAADGRLIGAIETIQDITEKKIAEEAVERQNRRLAQSERFTAQIIQGSTIPTFVINRDHVVTHWNRALERLTGMPAEEMVGTSDHWKPFRGNPRPLMADVIVDRLDESEIHRLYGSSWRPSTLIEGAYEAEEFLPRLGIEGKWCWFTGAPIKDPDGSIVGAIETLQDVTEKMRSEAQCRRHTQKLATLCSIHTVLNAPLSLDECIDAALKEVGNFLSADSICLFMLEDDGRQWFINYPRGGHDAPVTPGRCGADDMVSRVANDGKVRFFHFPSDDSPPELENLRAAGIRSIAYVPVAPEEGRIFGVIRMCSRRTNHFDEEDLYALELIGNRIGAAVENAMLNDELRRKNNFQSKLIRSSTDAIVATDETLRIVMFNPAAEALFGCTRDEVLHRRRAFDLYPDQVEELWDAEEGRDRRWEFPWKEITITRRDGEVVPVRYSGTLLHEGDRMMGSVAFFQDLREIKRLEAELLQSERLAAVGQTVAGMAHCIKNILHGLKGGSYMIDVGLARDDREKLQSGWRMVQRNINRTSDLVLDLLSYSKEREPDYAPCDPNEVVQDVCDLVHPEADESGVALASELDPAIGRVAMDSRTVHRCLLNLLSNAVDACAFDEDINKRHQVVARTILEPGDRIRFEVEDNGAGMTESVKQRLFTSFFSTKGSQGTGLGLLVTRKLIEAHQGTIEVASELGRGTRFTFYLPFFPVAQATGGAPVLPSSASSGEGET
jgi:PAS domain S-box-containing protein